MWIWTAIATVSGLTGTFYGVRGYRYATGADVRRRQSELRTELRSRLNQQNRFKRALENLPTGMPSSLVSEDIGDFGATCVEKSTVFSRLPQTSLMS